jgi:hypothetical membrane protein
MAAAVIMVGIFSEDYGRIHYIVAAVFFVLLLIFMTIINIVLTTHTKYIKWIRYYAILSILMNVIFILTFIIGLDIYVLDWLVVFSGLIWMGLFAYNALKIEDHVSN